MQSPLRACWLWVSELDYKTSCLPFHKPKNFHTYKLSLSDSNMATKMHLNGGFALITGVSRPRRISIDYFALC